MSIYTYREALEKLDEFEEITGNLQCQTWEFIEKPFNKIKQIIKNDLKTLELTKMSKSFE